MNMKIKQIKLEDWWTWTVEVCINVVGRLLEDFLHHTNEINFSKIRTVVTPQSLESQG